MTDTDNTGERTTAYYGDIVFKKRDGVGGTRNGNDAGLQIRIALIKLKRTSVMSDKTCSDSVLFSAVFVDDR